MSNQQGGPGEEKQPFIDREDRPEVAIDPEKPISELRVRDLSQIITQAVIKKWELKEPIKEKFEKHEWKELKPEKFEKHEWKEHKPEIKELKHEKFEKNEFKEHKPEKEFKLEKIEADPVKQFGDNFPGPDPTTQPIQQLVELVSNLSRRVDQLADQVAKLEQKQG